MAGMSQSDIEIISEILGLTEKLGSLAVQEAQIREQIEQLAGLLATSVELRDSGAARREGRSDKPNT
jgi:hypothetical protein